MTSCDKSRRAQIVRNRPEYAGFANFELDTTIDGALARLVTSDLQAAGVHGLPIVPAPCSPSVAHGRKQRLGVPTPTAPPTCHPHLDAQQHAITHLHDAALATAERLRQLGRYDHAEHAIRQGLTLYDPSEPLYVEWFHLEHARGHPERIPHPWRRLQQRYADQADETAGIITTPTIETELAYTSLMRGRPT